MPTSDLTSQLSLLGVRKLDSAHALVNEGGRALEVVAFEQEVVAFFVNAANSLGMPKSLAAIYGICFASTEPLTFTEIQAKLDLSAGSVSQGLRVLRGMGALKTVGTSGDRRERFVPDLELRKLAALWIEERLEQQLRRGGARLKALRVAIPAEANGSAKVLQKRFKHLQNWHDKSRALVPVMKTLLKV